MKLKPIPRSKAKTAYGLVSDVIKAMDEEPKRVDMGTFGRCVLPKEGGPACGTIGCFAGWVAILGGNKTPKPNRANYSYEQTAKRLLGECDFFDPETNAYVFDAGWDISGRPGTRAYARQVIARIKRFRANNAAHLTTRKLKARKLAGVR